MELDQAALMHSADTYIIQECGCLLAVAHAYVYQPTEATQCRLAP